MVSLWRGKPKLVVNIEISKDGDLHERVEEQNVLHTWKLNSQRIYYSQRKPGKNRKIKERGHKSKSNR
ncbi:hypothetical protein E2C01_089680 [Portunus trituberculatus]|uniref:Uncharacterized protein n=1 Tax=Portunus trituberculatus TaxID=210409 RepID=A0A5B7JI44_PORTR|nr:hypothetical protein [Portunus trituberculatus]